MKVSTQYKRVLECFLKNDLEGIHKIIHDCIKSLPKGYADEIDYLKSEVDCLKREIRDLKAENKRLQLLNPNGYGIEYYMDMAARAIAGKGNRE